MAIAGKGGGVKTGTNAVGEVHEWKLDIEADMLETTNFSSGGWKEYIAGLKDWSGSIDAYFDLSDAGQSAVHDALMNGTSLSLELDIDGTHKYTGAAFVKKASPDTPVGDLIKVGFDFQGSGALTYA